MRSGLGGRAQGGPANRRWGGLGVIVALAVALTASGCTHNGQPAPFATARNGTLAFESIDGPPIGVFDKLVHNLSQEAQTLQLAVVSREGPSQYRVRGYLAAHVARGRTSIAWAWDVYDSQQRRILRITGDEPAGRHARDAWNAANDGVLRKIARTSLERLTAYLGAPAPAPAIDTEASPERAIALAAAQP